MTFNLQRILDSKQANRQRLASRPIAEKLRMLDALREREVAIRGKRGNSGLDPRTMREASRSYGSECE